MKTDTVSWDTVFTLYQRKFNLLILKLNPGVVNCFLFMCCLFLRSLGKVQNVLLGVKKAMISNIKVLTAITF